MKASFSGSGVLVARKSRRKLSLSNGFFLSSNSVMLYRDPACLTTVDTFGSCKYGFIRVPASRRNVGVAMLRSMLGGAPGIGLVCMVPAFRGPAKGA